MDEAKNDVSYRTVRGREARAEALNSLVRAELSKSRMADALKMSKLRALRLAQNAEETAIRTATESAPTSRATLPAKEDRADEPDLSSSRG